MPTLAECWTRPAGNSFWTLLKDIKSYSDEKRPYLHPRYDLQPGLLVTDLQHECRSKARFNWPAFVTELEDFEYINKMGKKVNHDRNSLKDYFVGPEGRTAASNSPVSCSALEGCRHLASIAKQAKSSAGNAIVSAIESEQKKQARTAEERRKDTNGGVTTPNIPSNFVSPFVSALVNLAFNEGTTPREREETANAVAEYIKERFKVLQRDTDMIRHVPPVLVDPAKFFEEAAATKSSIIIPVRSPTIEQWSLEGFLKSFELLDSYVDVAAAQKLRLIYVLDRPAYKETSGAMLRWVETEAFYRAAMEMVVRRKLCVKDVITWFVADHDYTSTVGEHNETREVLFENPLLEDWKMVGTDGWYPRYQTASRDYAVSIGNDRTQYVVTPAATVEEYPTIRGKPLIPIPTTLDGKRATKILKKFVLGATRGEAYCGWRPLSLIEFLALPHTRVASLLD